MYCPNPSCPDREATGSPGEYRDDLTRCPYCGEELVTRERLRQLESARRREEAQEDVVVLRSRHMEEADLAAEALEEAGLQCRRQTRRHDGMVIDAPSMAPGDREEHLVVVRGEEVEAAVEVLARVVGSEPLNHTEEVEAGPEAIGPGRSVWSGVLIVAALLAALAMILADVLPW